MANIRSSQSCATPTTKGRVLVTGSTQGIGRAAASRFAASGWTVIVHGKDSNRAEQSAAELTRRGFAAQWVSGDLADPLAPDRVITQACEKGGGELHALVNNAGTNVFTGIFDTSPDDWDYTLAVDLRAAWLCARAASRVMPPSAAIVNVASNHAFRTIAGCFPYNVAKAGLVALGQSLALELAPAGIRVNTVCPGYIDTPLTDSYFQTFSDPTAERSRVAHLHPIGRLGSASEVAAAIEYLADSTRSSFITGTILTVDGGRSALLQDPT